MIVTDAVCLVIQKLVNRDACRVLATELQQELVLEHE